MADRRIPLLLVGDGPQEPTGLGRIARDLAGLIVQSDLPVDLVQVGGVVPPVWQAWRHVPLDPSNQDWGASQVEAIYRSLWGTEPGILWVVWDPGRLFAYHELDLPVQKWAYTAIDSTNVHGSIGGPARIALERFDRVLAYGKWASRVVRTLRPTAPYLPHGVTPQVYQPDQTEEGDRYVRSILGPFCREDALLIGCVATNQPRKDLSLFFGTLAELKRRGRKVYGWLHTDVLVKSWAIPQLVEDFGLQKQISLTVPPLRDQDLARLYQSCDLTMAPGLGEGFCYPIVESLASGVPCLHGNFGGGVELIPKGEWRVPVLTERLESVYAVRRPVFGVVDWANAVERILAWRGEIGSQVASAYCRLSVQHLDWKNLWPRWHTWIKEGL